MNIRISSEAISMSGTEYLAEWLQEEGKLEQYLKIVDFIIVDENVIREINNEYLNHDYVTDVIAFSFDDDHDDMFINEELEDMCSGEVYICIQQAKRQASEYACSLEEEVGRLAIHGLLHLAGWEDANASDKRAMIKREDEGLQRARSIDGEFKWKIIS